MSHSNNNNSSDYEKNKKKTATVWNFARRYLQNKTEKKTICMNMLELKAIFV